MKDIYDNHKIGMSFPGNNNMYNCDTKCLPGIESCKLSVRQGISVQTKTKTSSNPLSILQPELNNHSTEMARTLNVENGDYCRYVLLVK